MRKFKAVVLEKDGRNRMFENLVFAVPRLLLLKPVFVGSRSRIEL